MPFLGEVKFPLVLGKVKFKAIRTVCLGKKVILSEGVTIGENVTIGNRSFIGSNSYIDGDIKIGSCCSISRNVNLLTRTHRIDQVDKTGRRAGEVFLVSPLEIGNGVWIGTNATVLPKVKKVGSFAIIGAGAVVTKDVPENTIVAGNPARVIRKLEPPKKIFS